MLTIIFMIVLFCGVGFAEYSPSLEEKNKADLLVTVKQGKLTGRSLSTEYGYSYNAFLGVPYAKPPVGDLRFRDPQPPEKWEGVRECIVEGNDNPQIDTLFTQRYKGDEDSLYLNIYTPNGTNKNSKLPVMIFIHGGGFNMGSGSRMIYGPDYFVQMRVILVTINYRLGPLGFLCLNTPEVPGNAGLKDQVFALRWINENIKSFGGDSDNVLIFGHSAGSASVQYQILSPMAKGLFNKAIMQSGTATSLWAKQIDPEKNAFDLARSFGMESNDKEAVLKFLRQVPAKDMIEKTTRRLSLTELPRFLPVIEQNIAGVESFITMNPNLILMSGNFNRVQLMCGYTSQEGALMLTRNVTAIKDFSKVTSLSDTGLDLKLILSASFSHLNTEAIFYLANKIEEFYFGRGGKPMDNYINLLSDLLLTLDIFKSIELHKKFQQVYRYELTYHGGLNLYKLLIDYPYNGASHGDELGYLFKQNLEQLPEGVVLPPVTDLDILTVKRIVTLWSNFAKSGNPTPNVDDVIPTIWDPVTENDDKCYQIGDTLKMERMLIAGRMQFWSGLMK